MKPKIILMGFVLAALSVNGFSQESSDRSGHQEGQHKRGSHNGKGMNVSHQRHHYFHDKGLSENYKDLSNPLTQTDTVLNEGASLYEQNCARCHGKEGMGDGPESVSLNPKPTNIAHFSSMPMAKDSYLMWTLAEGGIPLNSPMPAFKGSLSSDAMWKIISHLRSLKD